MPGRVAAAGLATSVAALGLSANPASAASEGVGTATVSTSVLEGALGDLLGVRLLEDVGRSTTDPKVGPAGASSVLRQLALSSSTVSSLNHVVGEHKVTAPGGPSEVTTALLDLDTLGLGGVVDGTIEPILMKALHQPSSATATSARITDLGVLGGLANLGVLRSSDRTGSGTAAAEAGRAMSLDAISVLELGALLRGLGLDILTLPLDVVSGLVSSLGIPVDLEGAASLAALVTSLTGSIEALADADVDTVTAPLLSQIGGLGLPAPLLPAVETALPTAITTLQSTLTTLINTVTTLLEGATLLKLTALDINTVARAADTVAASEATATGTLGGLQVGPVALPGIDLAAVTSALNGLLAQVQAAIGTVLAPLGITDLLSLRLFDRQTGVTEADGVVKAVSSITGLVVKVTPPADLAATVSRLTTPTGGLGALLPAAGAAKAGKVSSAAAMPAAAANPLEAVLGLTSILEKGLELRVGTVQSQSLHAVPARPATTPTGSGPGGDLARTGGEQTMFALLALGLAALGLGGRRLYRREAEQR